MLQLDHMFNMEKIGLVSREAARRHVQNVVPYYFGSRHGKHWWRWQEGELRIRLEVESLLTDSKGGPP